jgi:hypothetical protein
MRDTSLQKGACRVAAGRSRPARVFQVRTLVTRKPAAPGVEALLERLMKATLPSKSSPPYRYSGSGRAKMTTCPSFSL